MHTDDERDGCLETRDEIVDWEAYLKAEFGEILGANDCPKCGCTLLPIVASEPGCPNSDCANYNDRVIAFAGCGCGHPQRSHDARDGDCGKCSCGAYAEWTGAPHPHFGY
jgi:hypothetical protein